MSLVRRGGNHRFDVFSPYAITRGEWLAAFASGLGLAAAVLGTGTGWPMAGVGMVLGVVMALVSAIDWRLRLIPDALSYPITLAGLMVAAFLAPDAGWPNFTDHLFASLVAGAGFLAIRSGYKRWRGIEGLGLGDVKLAAAAGAWVGLDGLGTALLLACGGALLVVSLQSIARGAPLAGSAAVPFGTFIAPAIAVTWLAQSWPL